MRRLMDLMFPEDGRRRHLFCVRAQQPLSLSAGRRSGANLQRLDLSFELTTKKFDLRVYFYELTLLFVFPHQTS